MLRNMLSSLTTKVGIGLAAVALAAGTGGVAVTAHLISDSEVDGTDTTVIHDPATPAADDDAATDAEVDDTADVPEAPDVNAGADHQVDHEHPDNFGATVSADAHDGGVDGHEISTLAHEKNGHGAAEATDDEATDDSADEATDDSADEADDDEATDDSADEADDDEADSADSADSADEADTADTADTADEG